MEPTIIIAILTIAGNIIVSWISQSKTKSLIEYRLKALEEKVNQHNNLIARMYNIETKVAVIEKEIEELDDKN